MENTIYAAFADAALAEKAIGALLDNGADAKDISVVSGHRDTVDVSNPYAQNERIWTGGDGDMTANRYGYTHNQDDVEVTGLGTSATASELAAQNSGYGDTAARTEAYGLQDRTLDPNETDKDTRTAAEDVEASAKHGFSTTTAGDAGAGAIKGAGWGAGIGIIAAIAAVTVPGFGLVLGGGALAAAIGAAAATAGAGAIAGGVTGYLKDQGVDDQIAANYGKVVQEGGTLVNVSYPSGTASESTIRQVLEKYGAVGSDQNPRGYVA